MLFFTTSNLKSAKTYKLRWVLLSHKTVYSTSTNSSTKHQQTHIVISIDFLYTMYYTFHCELLHSTFHISLSFFLIALESRCCPFKRFIIVLKKIYHGSVNCTSCNSWKWRSIHLEQHNIHCISKFILFSLKFSLISSCS